MRTPTSIVRAILAAVPALAFLQPAATQQPKVGDPAPPITLGAWLNVEAGKGKIDEPAPGKKD